MSFTNNSSSRYKLALALLALFFAARLGFGYLVVPNAPRVTGARALAPQMRGDMFGPARSFATSGERRYERIMTLVISTRDFDRDRATLTKAVDAAKGIVQFERETLRSDSATRSVVASISLPAGGAFDGFVKTMREMGKLESADDERLDATDEYAELTARRDALEESHRALIEMRRNRGSIEEMADLQRRILIVDSELRDIRAKAAMFDDAREVVRLTLYEDFDVTIPPPHLTHRVMVAFKWAIKYWAVSICAITLFSLLVLALGVIFSRLADAVSRRGRHEYGEQAREMPAMRRITAESQSSPDEDA